MNLAIAWIWVNFLIVEKQPIVGAKNLPIARCNATWATRIQSILILRLILFHAIWNRPITFSTGFYCSEPYFQ